MFDKNIAPVPEMSNPGGPGLAVDDRRASAKMDARTAGIAVETRSADPAEAKRSGPMVVFGTGSAGQKDGEAARGRPSAKYLNRIQMLLRARPFFRGKNHLTIIS